MGTFRTLNSYSSENKFKDFVFFSFMAPTQ